MAGNHGRVVWLIGVVSLSLTLLLAVDGLPWLRGDVPWLAEDSQWVWFYVQPRWGWLAVCAAGLALYGVGALILLRRECQHSRTPVRLVLWAFIGLVFLSILVLAVQGSPLYLLFTRTASPLTGGYLYAANRPESLADILRGWPEFVTALKAETHLTNGVILSPPGGVALFKLNAAALDAAPQAMTQALAALNRPQQCQNLALLAWDDLAWANAWLQMAMPLWTALAVAPLYRLGRLVFDRRTAMIAILLWPLVPGLSVFQPRFNTGYAVLALLMLFGLWRGLLGGRGRWLLGAGGVLSLGTFLNLALIPLGLLAGLTVGLYHSGHRAGWAITRLSWVRLGRDLALFGAGVCALWVVYWALTGLSPWVIVQAGLDTHYDLSRPYGPWLLLHPYDMVLFTGFPLAGLVMWRVARLPIRRGPMSPSDCFSAAVLLTLLILVLSGTARGETGRVWLWLAPGWVLIGAQQIARLRQRDHMLLIAVQAVGVLVVAGFLDANFTTYRRPPRPAEAGGAPVFAVHARFERASDRITLVGLDAAPSPDAITLTLYWRAGGPVTGPYVLTLNSLTPEGQPGPSLNWNPRDWELPPACWPPGRTFTDSVQIGLPDGSSGAWLFSLSILGAFDQQPMTVTLPDGTTSTQVGIGPVQVPPRASP